MINDRYNDDPLTPLTLGQLRTATLASAQFKKWALVGRISHLETLAAGSDAGLNDLSAEVGGLQGGAVAYNSIPIAVNVTAGDTLTIGADVYEFVVTGGDVGADTNIGVVRESSLEATMANLLAAINATAVTTSLFQTDSTTPALLVGTENVVATYDSGSLHIYAADAPGGTVTLGTVPDIACSDNLTEATAWVLANLILSTGGSFQPTVVARVTFSITADQIVDGSVVVRVPVYSPSAAVKLSAMSAAGAVLAGYSDTVAILPADEALGFSTVTLTLPGGGSDLAATNVVFIEVWA